MTDEDNRKLFLIYERIRKSGKTNMFDIPRVRELSKGKLDRDDIIRIMSNYLELSRKYLCNEK